MTKKIDILVVSINIIKNIIGIGYYLKSKHSKIKMSLAISYQNYIFYSFILKTFFGGKSLKILYNIS